MAEMHPEYKANLERALEILFEFSPDSVERIAPFRRALEKERKDAMRVLEEEKRNAMNAILQAKREALQLLLESKFGLFSEAFVSKLEAVHDIDELNRLYRQALQAQTLEAVGL